MYYDIHVLAWGGGASMYMSGKVMCIMAYLLGGGGGGRANAPLCPPPLPELNPDIHVL